ncbi:hypothetical protein GGC47_003691 [Bosea sp. OAE752]|uniref:hypothetical protein n=1 Tax=unclassified Bosea (in: a-proteobacteria) TaxID=2653178 RepID=UPI00163AC6D6
MGSADDIAVAVFAPGNASGKLQVALVNWSTRCSLPVITFFSFARHGFFGGLPPVP